MMKVGSTVDGWIQIGGTTHGALMKSTPELTAMQLRTYKQRQARYDSDQYFAKEAEKAIERTKKQKAARERAKKEAEKENKVEVLSNEDIIKSLIIKYNEDSPALRNELISYSITNPSVVTEVLSKVDYSDTDDLSVEILKYFTQKNKLHLLSNDLLMVLKTHLIEGWTTDEEYRLIEKIENLNSNKKNINVKKEFDNNRILKDIKSIRIAFNENLGGSVGLDCLNNPVDVREVFLKLSSKGYEPSKSSLEDGIIKESDIEIIKKFQKDVLGSTNPDGKIDPGKGTFKALFGKNGEYKSGLPKIYAGRSELNKYLNTYNSSLKGDVGADSKGNKAENFKEDVIQVSEKLESREIKVPKDSILKGSCSGEFISSIKKFQKSKGITSDGNITKGGKTDKILNDYENQYFNRIEKKGSPNDYEGVTNSEDYYKKVDTLIENLDVSEDLKTVLAIAKNAATNNKYYESITSGVSANLLIESEDVESGGSSLSSVFETRMRRLHKFLVLCGLYKGDMKVNDAVRSEKKAHQFSVQYQILKGTYENKIKDNLIKMYNNEEELYTLENYIQDIHKNKWAKKSYFKVDNKGKAIDLDMGKVRTYVGNLDFGRKNIRDAASAGFRNEPFCLPLPEKLGVSMHTKGGAMDVDRHNFIYQKEAMIDLIALTFGVVRSGGWDETWHFELSDLELSKSEKEMALEKNR
ncbi:hypothetical protein [Marinigracilibium pacificum]|uniref:Uncharacterized protein n=1 Tax=Marinigracilibium pacificum TaxID=2729599 RepID=A0A848JAJ2_9BACT|nr:hypothetical protein [Marinigracilibium pacificum]NMM50062.1 hypothetical protein [Marinigracilibium pacificum]